MIRADRALARILLLIIISSPYIYYMCNADVHLILYKYYNKDSVIVNWNLIFSEDSIIGAEYII